MVPRLWARSFRAEFWISSIRCFCRFFHIRVTFVFKKAVCDYGKLWFQLNYGALIIHWIIHNKLWFSIELSIVSIKLLAFTELWGFIETIVISAWIHRFCFTGPWCGCIILMPEDHPTWYFDSQSLPKRPPPIKLAIGLKRNVLKKPSSGANFFSGRVFFGNPRWMLPQLVSCRIAVVRFWWRQFKKHRASDWWMGSTCKIW